MAYECPEYDWNQFDQNDRHQCCQLTNMHHDPRRRRSASRKCSQQTPWQAPPSHLHYPRSQYFDNEKDVYEPPLRYGELDEENMPDDHLLDDYYMNSAPIPPWPRPPRQFRQRPRPGYHYENEDGIYSYNGNGMPARVLSFNYKVNGAGRYFGPMTSSPLPHQSTRQNYTSQQLYKQSNRPTRILHRAHTRSHQPRHSLNLDFTDYSDDDDENDNASDSNNHHRTRQHISTQGKNTPRRRHSLQHLHHRQQRSSLSTNSPIMGSFPDASPVPVRHHQQPILQPMLQTDTQHPLSFYGQAPPHGPSVLPMPQPMIHPSAFLPYHHPHPQLQLGYGAPTVPGMVPPPGSTTTPGSSMPFSPMMMMLPPSLPPSLSFTQSNNGIPQQTDTKTGAEAETAAVPTPPPSDDTETPQDSPNVNNTSSPPATSSLLSSASAPASTMHRKNGENSLVPLVRSLSLGESRSLGTKPRRRSLFESLFSLDGFKLSRNNSLSSNINSTNDSTSSPSTTTTTTTRNTTPSSSSSMIPVHELTTHTLTRKQSLSLEKKVKALSQRSYIWCYQIKPLPGQQQQHETGCWVAMTPKNQTKLDPYICYYHPSAMVKGARTDNLSTLVTLDKEPKLSGSFTIMPQAKIARVYPSMFSSANYIEVLIDCLPADSQFVVRSG